MSRRREQDTRWPSHRGKRRRNRRAPVVEAPDVTYDELARRLVEHGQAHQIVLGALPPKSHHRGDQR
ncbi:MAG: hypothetical protein ACR2LE_03270 [Nocardioidaceae bacterium]